MDLLKALKRTTILSAAALLALGATEAGASNSVAVGGKVNCSVTALLTIVETQQVKFGNIAVAEGTTVDGDTVTLNLDGTRVHGGGGGKITLLYGSGLSGAGGPNGNYDTGSQVPGLYTVTAGEGTTNIYISFANEQGAIMDTEHGEAGSSNATSVNFVSMTLNGLGAGDTFSADHFTFQLDTPLAAGNPGYGTPNPANVTDTYGTFVPCASPCRIRVGASMHTHTVDASTWAPGRYTGTFQMMVSY